jgi:hypothetical protein
LAENIKNFVELLSDDSRVNDVFIYEKIYKSLERIFNIAEKTSIDVNKLRNLLLKRIRDRINLDNIKTEIITDIDGIIHKQFNKKTTIGTSTKPHTTFKSSERERLLPKREIK